MNRKQLNHRVRAFAHGTLKLSEETYREVIRDVTTDKEHITDCTNEEAQLVLTALRRFHVMRLTGSAGNVPGRPPTQEGLERQHSLIPRLMDFLRWDWKSTAGFCEKVTGKKDTRQCDARELSKVIRGMVAVIEHDLARGRITMTPDQLATFRRHTAKNRGAEEAGNVIGTSVASNTSSRVPSPGTGIVPRVNSVTPPQPQTNGGNR